MAFLALRGGASLELSADPQKCLETFLINLERSPNFHSSILMLNETLILADVPFTSHSKFSMFGVKTVIINVEWLYLLWQWMDRFVVNPSQDISGSE